MGVPSAESAGSNTKAPGIVGNERSSATYMRIAKSTLRQRFPAIGGMIARPRTTAALALAAS